MASWLSFTNHKLYQCRLLLQQAQQTTEPVVLKDALQDSALHLLHDAYLSYLHELAELATYRQSVESLAQLLQVTPLVTGEMLELEHLEKDSFSWLRQFLNAVDAVAQPNNISVPVTPVQPGMISLVDNSTPDISLWYERLTQLIDLQRENRQEC
ncbi:MAG: hypothetical protein MK185_07575 [Saccharospirillaceae bacterium]|nr:hypothetical protein A3759_13175 [Thalassolituus sp. HI0120]MCH2040476.1 hypothetical protein [Saccharospirillaceae bacterium]